MIEKEGLNPEVSEVVDLLLGYDNPNKEEISELIIGERDRDWRVSGDGTQYSTIWERFERYKPETKDDLKERLSGQILVDLGGGRNPKYVQELAKNLGAAALVNVDPQAAPATQDLGGTKFIPVKKDMLSFTSQLKSNSCNFVITGIDEIIIPNSDYHKALASEMIRATRPNGVIFAAKSGVLPFLKQDGNLETILSRVDGELMIYKKPEHKG